MTKKIKRELTIFSLISGAIIAASVILSIHNSTKSTQLLSLEQKTESLLASNRELNAQLVEKESVTNLTTQAQTLNLQKPSQVFYLRGTLAKLP